MKTLFALLTFLALAALFVLPAFAAEELIYSVTGDGYHRYEFPDGVGFMATSPRGEQNAAFMGFSFDEGVNYAFFRAGAAYPAEGTQVFIAEAGSYVLKAEHDGLTTEFTFSVSSLELGELGEADFDLADWFGSAAVNATPQTGFLPSEGLFSFTLPSGVSFQSSVPNGALASDGFYLRFPAETSAILAYTSGSGQKSSRVYESEQTLTEAGIYTFTIVQTANYYGDLEDSTTYYASFCARIPEAALNAYDVIIPPQDFTLMYLEADGVEIPVAGYEHGYPLTRDGVYFAEFTADFSRSLRFGTYFVRDTTSPLILFSANGLSGFSDIPVLYEPSEAGAVVSVRHNGLAAEPGGRLDKNGSYTLTVTDPAGNTRTYSLKITLKAWGWLDIILLVLTVCAAAAVVTLILRRCIRPRVI